jgi:hypothetical protein
MAKDVIDETQEKEFNKTVKRLITVGITEFVFTINEGNFKTNYRFLDDYSIMATAKVATFRTFTEKTYIKSFRFLGCDIHFLITE